MAGGEGTRLRPLTCEMPKPLAPIAGKACIYYIADLLLRHGIDRICATARYRADDVKKALKAITETDIRVYTEDSPLGTAGSVKNCEKFLDDSFIVISGDCICDFDLTKAVEYHKSKGGIATIVLTHAKDPLEYGVAVLGNDEKITRFIEKPSWSRAYSDTVNTGIYIFSPKIFDYIPADRESDFSKDIFPALMKEDIPIYGYVAEGYWCDIGNIKSFLQCNFDVLSGVLREEPVLKVMQTPAISLPETVQVRQPSYIGKNVKIEGGTIGPYAVIGDNCEIGRNVFITSSVLCNNVTAEDGACVRGSVICSGARLRSGVSVGEYGVVGANASVGVHTVIGAGSKIYPKNIIPEYSFVKSNVMDGLNDFSFEEEEISSAFDENTDISAFVRLGAAAASVIKRTAAVAIIRGNDSSAAAPAMLALSAGLSSASVDVFDLGECDVGMIRFAVREYGFGGGVFIKVSGGRISVSILQSDGLYMDRNSERKVEQTFSSGDVHFGSAGSFRPFRGYDRIYSKYFSKMLLGLSPLPAIVSGPTFITEKLSVKPGEPKLEYIYVMPDAMYVQTPEHEAYDEDLVNCVVAYCFGKLTGNAYVPYDWPMILDKIAAENGFELHRLTLEDKDRAKLDSISDVNIRAAVLLKYMSDSGMRFSDIAARIPVFSSRHREIDSPSDKAEMMRLLSEGSDRELVEGVRISDRRGSILIVPRKRTNSFRLFAEATDAETAAEICDFYVKKIKNRS